MPQIRLYKHLIDLAKSQDWNYTAPEIKRNIENYGAIVSGNKVTRQLDWIYPEQTIDVSHWPKREKADTSLIRVVYEDDNCMAIFKPKGLVVEKGAGHQTDNLVQWLHENYREQNFAKLYNLNQPKNSEYKLPESGLVHRLDKDTQGLLLIGKNPTTWQFLQDQFRERNVVKKYLAVVDGIFEQVVEVDNWQSRDRHNPIKQRFFWTETEAKDFDFEAREAKSIFRPIYICPEANQSLVQVQILTGRMHQIRLQAEALGFPLSHDQVYNSTVDNHNPAKSSWSIEEIYLVNMPQRSELNLIEFKNVQHRIFGESQYCLLSNCLEIILPDQNLTKIEIFPVAKK
jgi:RluA family pseudouridine synthase